MTAQRIMGGEDLTFDNLLLVGPPGTGKTLFARMLADSSGMYYAVTTAGALLQSDQGIEHLNGFIALAEHSSRPIILFFDEFDSFIVDRNKLDPSSQHYKVVNQFLALTGQRNKFMVIGATNHAQHLDSAIARRFQDRVDMELPTLHERKQLGELCVKQIVFNTKHNSADFIQHAAALIKQENIVERIANHTEGLSHAELDNLVSAMYKKALLSRNKRLTLEHAREATHEAMTKYNQFKADHAHGR
jgi:ATPase family AAA domain-containing protein 3A/B